MMAKSNIDTNICQEKCGRSLQYSEQLEVLDWMNDINGNDCVFGYDEVVKEGISVDINNLFTQTTYGYMISGIIDTEITNIFIDIKNNTQLMSNMSPEVIYLLNVSTYSIKQLFKYVYMLYICKFLANNGGDRCKSIDHFKYTSLITINNDNFIDSINDNIRHSEVVDAYIGFTKDVLIKKYYHFMMQKLDKIEYEIVKNGYKNVEIWMTELQSIVKNIIQYNIWFIIELNNFYTTGATKSPIFYVNDRMLMFYYGEIQLNYIAWWLNYIAPKENEARLQNRLERSMYHYYINIKEMVQRQTNNEVSLVDV